MESSSFAQSIRMPRDSANGRPHVSSARSRGRLACASISAISGVTEMQRRGQLRRRRRQEEQVSGCCSARGLVPCRAACRSHISQSEATHSLTRAHTLTSALRSISPICFHHLMCARAYARASLSSAQLSSDRLGSARSTSARPAARIRDASVAAAAIRVVFLDCSTFTAWPLSLSHTPDDPLCDVM